MEVWITLAAVWIAGFVIVEGRQLAGQEPTVNSIGVSFRGDYFANQDRLISPRVHDGFGISQGGVLLSRRSVTSFHELDVWIGSLPISSDGRFSFQTRRGQARTPESEVALGDASYAYLRRLAAGPWWLGFAASFEVAHSEYEFGGGGAEGFFYFGALHAAGRRDVPLGDGRRLVLSLRIPLIGWKVRPTYSTVDEDRLQASSDFLHRIGTGEFAWTGDVLAARGRATYEQPIGDHFAFRGGVRLGYVRTTDRDRFTSLRAGLDLSLLIQWPGGAR